MVLVPFPAVTGGLPLPGTSDQVEVPTVGFEEIPVPVSAGKPVVVTVPLAALIVV